MLWQKSGGAPQELPREDRDDAGLPWTDLANNPEGRVRCHWTQAPEPPAYDPATQALTWTADGWTVTELPPAAPAPVRIGKYWLLQRLTEEQEHQIAIREAQAAALTADQLASLAPEQLQDPTNPVAALFQFGRFMRRLNALTVVELNADATLAGVELFRLLGVFGDPAGQASHDAVAEFLRPPSGLEWDAAA